MQAAKRTPVDLQEWAISMMERHNRKSYLQAPAPKSLKEGTTPATNNSSSTAAATPVPKQTPTITTSKSARTPQSSQPSPYQQKPSVVDVNANEVSSPHRYYGSPGHHYSSSAARSPPPPSLEHLSLETKDDESRSGRHPTRFLGDPISAIDAPSRPFMSPRSVSSNNAKRTNLSNTTLPIRAAPPPNGPPPPPPVSAGGAWRGYPGQTPGTSS